MSGGRTNPDATLDLTWDYDIATDTWSSRSNLLAPKNVPAGVVFNGKLYSIGGGNGAPPFDGMNDVESFDPAANTWSPEPTSIAGRSFPGGTVVGNTLYAVGGRDGAATSLSTVEKLELSRPAATSATATAAATSTTATTSATTASASASATTTASTAASTTGSTATSASGALPCPESARAASRRREDEDPAGALLGRQRATRSLAPLAARPCGQPVTAARHDQAPELPGQAGGRSGLGKPTPTARGPSFGAALFLRRAFEKRRSKLYEPAPSSERGEGEKHHG